MRYREYESHIPCPICESLLYVEEIEYANKSITNYYCDCGYENEKYKLDLAFKFCK